MPFTNVDVCNSIPISWANRQQNKVNPNNGKINILLMDDQSRRQLEHQRGEFHRN